MDSSGLIVTGFIAIMTQGCYKICSEINKIKHKKLVKINWCVSYILLSLFISAILSLFVFGIVIPRSPEVIATETYVAGIFVGLGLEYLFVLKIRNPTSKTYVIIRDIIIFLIILAGIFSLFRYFIN